MVTSDIPGLDTGSAAIMDDGQDPIPSDVSDDELAMPSSVLPQQVGAGGLEEASGLAGREVASNTGMSSQVQGTPDQLFGEDPDPWDASPLQQPSRAAGNQCTGSGNAAPQQPRATRSMEQSDEERGDDGNGSDLYEGAEDYRRLQAMNELDRETILADRSVGRSDKRMRMERLEQAGRIAGQGGSAMRSQQPVRPGARGADDSAPVLADHQQQNVIARNEGAGIARKQANPGTSTSGAARRLFQSPLNPLREAARGLSQGAVGQEVGGASRSQPKAGARTSTQSLAVQQIENPLKALSLNMSASAPANTRLASSPNVRPAGLGQQGGEGGGASGRTPSQQPQRTNTQGRAQAGSGSAGLQAIPIASGRIVKRRPRAPQLLPGPQRVYKPPSKYTPKKSFNLSAAGKGSSHQRGGTHKKGDALSARAKAAAATAALAAAAQAAAVAANAPAVAMTAAAAVAAAAVAAAAVAAAVTAAAAAAAATAATAAAAVTAATAAAAVTAATAAAAVTASAPAAAAPSQAVAKAVAKTVLTADAPPPKLPAPPAAVQTAVLFTAATETAAAGKANEEPRTGDDEVDANVHTDDGTRAEWDENEGEGEGMDLIMDTSSVFAPTASLGNPTATQAPSASITGAPPTPAFGQAVGTGLGSNNSAGMDIEIQAALLSAPISQPLIAVAGSSTAAPSTATFPPSAITPSSVAAASAAQLRQSALLALRDAMGPPTLSIKSEMTAYMAGLGSASVVSAITLTAPPTNSPNPGSYMAGPFNPLTPPLLINTAAPTTALTTVAMVAAAAANVDAPAAVMPPSTAPYAAAAEDVVVDAGRGSDNDNDMDLDDEEPEDGMDTTTAAAAATPAVATTITPGTPLPSIASTWAATTTTLSAPGALGNGVVEYMDQPGQKSAWQALATPDAASQDHNVRMPSTAALPTSLQNPSTALTATCTPRPVNASNTPSQQYVLPDGARVDEREPDVADRTSAAANEAAANAFLVSVGSFAPKLEVHAITAPAFNASAPTITFSGPNTAAPPMYSFSASPFSTPPLPTTAIATHNTAVHPVNPFPGIPYLIANPPPTAPPSPWPGNRANTAASNLSYGSSNLFADPAPLVAAAIAQTAAVVGAEMAWAGAGAAGGTGAPAPNLEWEDEVPEGFANEEEWLRSVSGMMGDAEDAAPTTPAAPTAPPALVPALGDPSTMLTDVPSAPVPGEAIVALIIGTLVSGTGGGLGGNADHQGNAHTASAAYVPSTITSLPVAGPPITNPTTAGATSASAAPQVPNPGPLAFSFSAANMQESIRQEYEARMAEFSREMAKARGK